MQRLGRYELIRRLATGGMGEVLLGRRRGPGKIEKQVVIKRIRRDLSGDPRFVEMFLREAQLSMTLGHKNIVPVFDFGRAGQELFLTMEYVRGRDLARALAAARVAERPLSPTAVAHLGIEICHALDYAHNLGGDGEEPLVHRDLSPKNVLLSYAGEVVVADFGLAIPAAEAEGLAGVKGTPGYMSPEQARGEPVDHRSDLFSLGLILHEAAAGAPPYGRGDVAALIERARDAEREPLPDHLPAGLVAVISTATRHDRDDRFESARSMQLALDSYMVEARAAGAGPPAHELADWLGELFPERDPVDGGVTAVAETDLAAVTMLDDGADAVTREVRELGSIGSMLETIADPESVPAPPAGSSEPRHQVAAGEHRGRLWIALAAFAAIGAGVGLWVTFGDREDGRERVAAVAIDAGAAAAATDAAMPLAVDAASVAPIDAALAPVAIDAGPPRRRPDAGPRRRRMDASVSAPAGVGTVRVATAAGWAAVSVAGSKGCNETPCTLTLPAGAHRLRLRNPVTGASATRRIVLEPGKTTTVTVTLRAE